MYRARQEKLSQCLPEIIPVEQRHWEELAKNKDKIKLNPDHDAYRRLEDSGNYRAYTVRTANGELAGYAGYLISKHLHYQDHFWALSDLFYVLPEHRSRRSLLDRVANYILGPEVPMGAGTTLAEFIEENLRDAGVVVMHTTGKVSNPGLGRLMQKLGHTRVEFGYSKLLR